MKRDIALILAILLCCLIPSAHASVSLTRFNVTSSKATAKTFMKVTSLVAWPGRRGIGPGHAQLQVDFVYLGTLQDRVEYVLEWILLESLLHRASQPGRPRTETSGDHVYQSLPG